MPNLKPCPFCGSEAALGTVREESYGYWCKTVGVHCTACSAHAGDHAFEVSRYDWDKRKHFNVRQEAEAKACNKWNERTIKHVPKVTLT